MRTTQPCDAFVAEARAAGLATIEAIARALGLLEGDNGPRGRAALGFVFAAMADRTLWSRGMPRTADVTGGVPAGVSRR